MQPLAIDLFCGLGGWASGFLSEGYQVIGFDIELHRYPLPRRPGSLYQEWDQYRGQLVLQDVLTLHGSQFRNAAVIVASPPCQEFSYMAMPWKRGKAIAAALRGRGEFPEGYQGSRTIAELTALFDACFRIQREACEAAGRYIPMVVENVRGAQPWVGKAKANYGSFYLWGDVETVGDCVGPVESQKQSVWFNDDKRRAKKCGGDWFGSGSDCSLMRQMSSKSSARKAASAQIAKIPFELARYVAQASRSSQ